MNDDVPVSVIFKRAADVVEYVEDRYDIVEFSFVWDDDLDSKNFGEYVLTLYVDGEPQKLIELWNEIYDKFNTEGFVLSILPKEKIGEKDGD
jgi:hypothetical protein